MSLTFHGIDNGEKETVVLLRSRYLVLDLCLSIFSPIWTSLNFNWALLFYTTLVSAASVDGCFSSARRLETFQSSTMAQKWLRSLSDSGTAGPHQLEMHSAACGFESIFCFILINSVIYFFFLNYIYVLLAFTSDQKRLIMLNEEPFDLPGSSLSPFIHLMVAAGLLLMAVQVISVSLPSLRTSSRASMMGFPGGTVTGHKQSCGNTEGK